MILQQHTYCVSDYYHTFVNKHRIAGKRIENLKHKIYTCCSWTMLVRGLHDALHSCTVCTNIYTYTKSALTSDNVKRGIAIPVKSRVHSVYQHFFASPALHKTHLKGVHVYSETRLVRSQQEKLTQEIRNLYASQMFESVCLYTVPCIVGRENWRY